MEAKEICKILQDLRDISFNSELDSQDDKNINIGKQLQVQDEENTGCNMSKNMNEHKIFASLEEPCQSGVTKMDENHFSNTGNLVINDILPEEIWMKILLYCDVKDILSFTLTSKSANKIVDSNYFW